MDRATTEPAFLTWIEGIAERLGRGVAWLVLAMMLVQFLVVLLRYAFNFNSIVMQETVMYMHAAIFLLAASYTLKHNAHVRVDILYRRQAPRRKALIDLLGTLFLLLPMMGFILTSSLGYVGKSWAIFEGSPDGGIRGVFLLKTLIPAFAVLMIIQGIAAIIRNALIFSGRIAASTAEDNALEENL